MNQLLHNSLSLPGAPSLADIRASVDQTPTGTLRRDTLSAFDVLVSRMDLDLAATPASAEVIRRMFEGADPARLGVSARRYANIRSLVMRAVARAATPGGALTRTAPLSAPWAALLETAEPADHRNGVKRLAQYCSAVGVLPEDVCRDTLLDLHDAIAAEPQTKEPQRIVRATIASWNAIGQATPGWPSVVLCSPWKVEPDTFPLTDFPASFQADVARWTLRMTRPDPFDADAPRRALRPTTINGHVVAFRRFASALVRRGVVPIEGITGIAVFFEGANFNDGLRHFLRPGDGPDATRYALWHARLLLQVARCYVRVDAETLAEIAKLCAHLDPRLPHSMGQLSRDRLEQFDEPENVARLLGFPKAEAERAMRLSTAQGRARGVERALAVALLIDTSLRISNLRQIRPDVDLRRIAGRVRLAIKATSVKNRVDLAFELGEETVELLERFQKDHRRHLPGHQGPYLFPGRTGGPMSDPGMRQLICVPLKQHCGLTMNPHLFRHVLAKIIVERDPSMYAAVSRHLGHRSMSTTLASYLGTETAAASRKLNQMLREARDNPTLGED